MEKTIQFTHEEEVDGQLSFLDTTIIRTNSGPRFKVFRKPTNKEDFIHFLSAHPQRIKSGIVIGFFLRAFRICSPEHLTEELNHIIKTFCDLAYPKGLILKWKRKARSIHERKNTNSSKDQKTRIVAPNCKFNTHLQLLLSTSNTEIVTASGTKIGDMIRKKNKPTKTKDSVVYAIPCGGCNSQYFGETGRSLNTRLREHKNDLQHLTSTNAMVSHLNKTGHIPKFKEAKTLHQGLYKSTRKALESAHISCQMNHNQKAGSFIWSHLAAHAILHSNTQAQRSRDQRTSQMVTCSTQRSCVHNKP